MTGSAAHSDLSCLLLEDMSERWRIKWPPKLFLEVRNRVETSEKGGFHGFEVSTLFKFFHCFKLIILQKDWKNPKQTHKIF